MKVATDIYFNQRRIYIVGHVLNNLQEYWHVQFFFKGVEYCGLWEKRQCIVVGGIG